MTDLVIETRELRKQFGDKTAVEDLSLQVHRGEVFGFLGPNGAGKTTSIKMLLGLVEPTSGSGSVLGAPIGHRATRARIGFLPEHFRFHEWLTGRELLLVHGRFLGMSSRATKERADALLARVDLLDAAHRPIRTYSKGMMQRVGLAQALLGHPEVVFLDEPTSGIDINGRDAVRAIVRGLADDGCAVLIATHELDEAERLADRVVIIDHGTLIADGTLADLRKGHDEIRFRSDPDLDLRALAETGIIASKVGADEYVIDAPPHPRLMAQLGEWLAAAGHPLHDLRAGGQRLEDVFRRLTSGESS